MLKGGYPEIARIIHSHPTLSEAVMEAARPAEVRKKPVYSKE